MSAQRNGIRHRETKAALRTIFDSVHDAIFLHDTSGRILDVNQQVLSLYRVTRSAALTLSLTSDFSSPSNDLTLLAGYWARAAAGENVIFEWLARRPGDGSEFDVEVALRKIRLPRADAIIANVRDITRRKELENHLLLASRVLENSIEGITVTDAGGAIEMVNPAFTRITGYSAEEAIGKNPRLLKSEHHQQEFYEQMWQALLNEGHWSGEIWNRRKGGESYPEWLNISAIHDSHGRTTHYVGIFHDITEIKRSQERLRHQAYHDALTGLPNRTLFLDRLDVSLHHAQRHGQKLAVLFLDLDHFKHVNDSLGHAAGDDLLKEVAQRLRLTVRDEDTVARLGGDEFTVILTEVATPEEVALVADRVIEEIGKPFQLRGRAVHVGTSIGIGLYPLDGDSCETLVRHADMAMYRAKEQGRNNFQFFTHSLAEKALKRIWLEAELRRAVERQEFVLHYQPKYNLASGACCGMEALVRWQRPDGSLMAPADFIPLAEETGLIIDIGAQVLTAACAQLRAWLDAGLAVQPIAVNLSARQFWVDNLADRIAETTGQYGIPPELLELEITESLLMTNVERAITVLQRLRDLGFKLSLDDFGTGYSSLAYLKRFPICALKIDRSFVKDIPHNRDDMAIAAAVVSLAHSLDLTVIAEGVETAEQREFLRGLGCHQLQGFLYSRPLPAAAIVPLLTHP